MCAVGVAVRTESKPTKGPILDVKARWGPEANTTIPTVGSPKMQVSRREVMNTIENAVDIDADKLQEFVFRAVFAARP
jgi:hypothetical protein